LEVLERAAQALDQAGDVMGQGRVVALIGHVHVARGTLEEGVARLQAALEPDAAQGPTEVVAALHHALARLLFMQGQFAAALPAAERAGERARAVGAAGLLAEAEVARGWTLGLMGRDTEGLPVLREAARLAAEAGNLEGQSIALRYAALILEHQGVFAAARAATEQALALGEQLAHPLLIADALIRLAAQAYFTGQWAQAHAYVERVTALPERTPWHDSAPLLELGRLALAEGAWEEATRHLEACCRLAGRLGVRIQDRVAASLLAEREVREGRADLAVRRLQPYLDRPGLAERVVTNYVLPVLAWAYLEVGETERAARTIAQALRRARAARYRLALVDGSRVQALVAWRQGQRAAAERALAEGLRVAQALPHPYGAGRLLHVRGLIQRDRGDAPAAHATLEQAAALFRTLGARRDLEQTERVRLTLLQRAPSDPANREP
jgi:tetratricopeptide (TPR) repeat protein